MNQKNLQGKQVVGEGAVGELNRENSQGARLLQPFMFTGQLRGLEGCRTTPRTNAPQRHCDQGARQTRQGRGVGCQVITAITRQGSVTVSHICPPRLSGDRRGGDPDLPVSTDYGHYRECALQVIRGCTGLLCRKQKPSHYFLLTMISMARRREWRQ